MPELSTPDHRVLVLRVAYDGTEFRGYARQPGLRTVEGVLEEALGTVIRPPRSVRLSAAGRTDAGVHATGQVVSVSTDSDIDLGTLERSLSRLLPPDISVSVEEGWPGFDARRFALARRYRYKLLTSNRPDPLRRTRAWWVGGLPVGARDILEAAASLVVGTHDFATFCKKGESRVAAAAQPVPSEGEEVGPGKQGVVGGAALDEFVSPDGESGGVITADDGEGTRSRGLSGTAVRTVTTATWSKPECKAECCAEELWFEIEANAFCHQMVRRLVGAMVSWALRGEPPQPPEAVLEYRWKPAPPHGLYLIGVRYPRDVDGT